MDESLGTTIATSAVPGGSFKRVPSAGRRVGAGSQATSEPVTWDEMGQLGLHKALNEYYKLSASQRNLRCRAGTPRGLLCAVVYGGLIPQLPAALSPPALFAAAGWLAYAAAWLLYQTAVLTIPLALWLSFAAGEALSLTPAAAAAAARLHPAAGAAVADLAAGALPLPALLAGRPLAALLVLPALLLALRLAEGAVAGRRQERWERQRSRLTAADVQAQYAGWALPGGSPAGRSPAAAAVASAEQQAAQRQQLAQLQRAVGQLWAAVYGGESLPAEKLGSLHDVAAAVGRLCRDTGVQPPAAAAAGSADGDACLLLGLVRQIQSAVGVE